MREVRALSWGKTLEWFTSYLSDRTFVVTTDGVLSNVTPLSCGVPQGSILGPLLLSIYLLPLGQIFRNIVISCHCNADDTQFYSPLKSGHDSLQPLFDSLEDIKLLIGNSFLKLNETRQKLLSLVPFSPVQTLALCLVHSHNTKSL